MPDQAQVDINALVADMRKHTLTLSVFNLAIVLAVLGVVGALYMHSVRVSEAALAKADERYATYEKNQADYQAQLKSDIQTIATLQVQKAQVQTQVVYRDKQTAATIQTVTAPNRDAQQVQADVLSAYSFAPVKLDGDLFEFTQPETQTFVATKIDRDRLVSDLADETNVAGLNAQEYSTEAADLAAANSQLISAQATITGYKKLAKPSKFKAFLGVAEKVALFVGGIYLGSHL